MYYIRIHCWTENIDIEHICEWYWVLVEKTKPRKEIKQTYILNI